MKKLIKVIILIVISYVLERIILVNIRINSNTISDIITFFSITFGFYITSLSIMTTSKYMSKLHKISDEENQSQSLLNKLVEYYKNAIFWCIATICYFLILQLSIAQKDDANTFLLMGDTIALGFLPLIVFNFFLFYKLLLYLTKIIFREAEL